MAELEPTPRPAGPIISLIWAMARNGVIGRNNTLPWRLPADLQHFRRVTLGHHVVMGRKNYQDIGHALPGRTNIVVTRQPDWHAPGCVVVHSVDEALREAANDTEVFVIGGAEIYAQTLGRAQRLYLTEIDADIAGDTYFPPFDRGEWRELQRLYHPADDKNPHPYSFVLLERR
jgi:dihydrofolate reductase